MLTLTQENSVAVACSYLVDRSSAVVAGVSATEEAYSLLYYSESYIKVSPMG